VEEIIIEKAKDKNSKLTFLEITEIATLLNIDIS